VDAFQNRSGIESAAGQGWVLTHDIVLADSANAPSSKRLLLPPNDRVNFARQADGTYTAAGEVRFDGAVLRLESASPRTWELRFKDGSLWRFGQTDATGATASFLVEMVTADGRSIPINRRADHKITSIGAGERSYQMVYGAGDLVSEVRAPEGRAMKFTYTAARRIETLTDPEGGVTRFTYVGDDEYPAEPLCPQGTDGLRIKSIRYPGKANPTVNFHGTSRRVLKQTAADGRETRFEYLMSGACVTHVGRPGEVCAGPSCPTLDSFENFEAGWRFHGGVALAATMIDTDGRRTTERYNAQGYLIDRTDNAGQATHFERTAENRISQLADPLARTTAYRFDARGNLTASIEPEGRITETQYDLTVNRPARMRRWLEDGSEVDTDYSYDAAGHLTRFTDPLGQATRYGYTPAGQLESITDALNHTTRFQYNAAGDLVAATDPLERTTRYRTDQAGRTVATTDPLGHATEAAYDRLDRPTQDTDALGGLTRYTYADNRQLASVIDPLGHAVESYGYDAFGRLTDTTDALGRAEHTAYDSRNRITGRTDRNGRTTTFDYDGAGRLAKVAYPDATRLYTYDAAGQLTELREGGEALQYNYDKAGRVVRIDQDGTKGKLRLDYAYDTLDRLIRRTVDFGPLALEAPPDVTEYAYDKAGRLTEIRYRGQTTRYQWDAANRLTKKTLPNGIAASYTYDAAGQLTRLRYEDSRGQLIDGIGYRYDATGHRIERQRTQAGQTAPETPFEAEYDAANRMTRITLKRGAPFEDQSYDLDYDANGNLLRKSRSDGNDTTVYTWDGRDRLVRIEQSGDVTLLAEFTYDPLGRRSTRTVNGLTTRYVYDGVQAIAELTDGKPLVTLLTGLQIDEAIARYSDTGERTALTDALGSVLALAGEDQAPTAFYAYSPYGETAASGERTDNASQYTGRENDGTGLYYYRARYYDSGLKRFVSEDPIGLAGGLNSYAYVGNNPLKYIDPKGTTPLIIPAIVACAADPLCWVPIAAAITSCANKPHDKNRKSLNDLINDLTNGGRKPLSADDADAAIDLGKELGIPGVRDDRDTDHWEGGPHIHIPGTGIGHIPADPQPQGSGDE
jgi:RHS repeat-associated protein